jgi:hypothetical protein
MKVTYANGDVYSAGDVNDITGTVNLLQTSTLSRAAGKNAIINGGFDIWQRGTSFVPSTVGATSYTADRWSAYRNATGSTVTRQLTSDTTNLPNIQYCARVSRDSGNTSTQAILLATPLELAQSIPYANGRTVTLSFYARKGANYSAASNALAVVVLAGTGSTETNPLFSGYTGQYAPVNTSVTLTTTWQRFTQTFTFAAADTQFTPYFQSTPVGTAGAADYFEVTGVQVELGSYATTFSRAGGTIQGELAACQRYYWRSTAGTVYASFSTGQNYSTTQALIHVINPVSMRTAASAIEYSALGVTNSGATPQSLTNLVIDYKTALTNNLTATVASGLVAGNATILAANNNAAAYLAFSAEL